MPRFRRLLRWCALSALILALAGVVAGWITYASIAKALPDVQQLREVKMQEPLYVHAGDGRLMAVFGETRRYPVTIDQVPERLKQAFLATEDARFYQHGGVDYRGVGRALWQLATTWDGSRVSGGSTITQQVARQFFLSQEYKIKRKLAEMLLARRMEKELGKDEIFELYLNKSFFGNRAYGIAAAAEFYYGKTLDELDLDEMASLAAIPKFPSTGNPLNNPVRARERRDVYVLERMRELGFISAEDAEAAKAVPMHAAPHDPPVEVHAPYVAEMVRQEMIERYGGDVLTRGYRVTTTIDPALQAAANQAVVGGLEQYDHRHGWRKPAQTFTLDAADTPETIAARLSGFSVQSGLVPAIVLATGEQTADVVLADARVITLDAASSRWTRRTPAALLQRGDVVRVRQLQAPAAGGGQTPQERWQLEQIPRAQATLISLEPDTGKLKALVGGFSFSGSSFNRAVQARRQPGSSFKPFIYAAAFEKGFHPASIVLDAPVVFLMARGKEWRPQNNTGDFVGPMRAREALVQSRNLVSVRLLDAIGVDYARRYISQFGFREQDLPPNLSIALGTPSLTPLEIARGYAVFVNGGFLVEPWFIDEVQDRDGQVIFKQAPAIACRACGSSIRRAELPARQQEVSHLVDGFDLGPLPGLSAPPPIPAAGEATEVADEAHLAPRVVDARIAWQMVSMMRDVVLRGTGAQARSLGRADVGGKTGTTNDYRDAWFSGFGGNLVTSVWVGRDDNQSLGYREYGSRSALPIWIDYMKVALKDAPVAEYAMPPGMLRVRVDGEGHLLPGDAADGITEYIKAEDLPRMQRYSILTTMNPYRKTCSIFFDAVVALGLKQAGQPVWLSVSANCAACTRISGMAVVSNREPKRAGPMVWEAASARCSWR